VFFMYVVDVCYVYAFAGVVLISGLKVFEVSCQEGVTECCRTLNISAQRLHF
jgi:hypothetical protein